MFKQQASKSSLFLLELIIVIFFFAISGAVCVQLYAKAHVLSTSTRDLNVSITKVAGVAEIVKSSPENPDLALLSAFNGWTADGQKLQIGYNKSWEVCPLENAVYLMTIDWEKSGQMVSAVITMEKKRGQDALAKDLIYSLDVVKHIPIRLN